MGYSGKGLTGIRIQRKLSTFPIKCCGFSGLTWKDDKMLFLEIQELGLLIRWNERNLAQTNAPEELSSPESKRNYWRETLLLAIVDEINRFYQKWHEMQVRASALCALRTETQLFFFMWLKVYWSFIESSKKKKNYLQWTPPANSELT